MSLYIFISTLEDNPPKIEMVISAKNGKDAMKYVIENKFDKFIDLIHDSDDDSNSFYEFIYNKFGNGFDIIFGNPKYGQEDLIKAVKNYFTDYDAGDIDFHGYTFSLKVVSISHDNICHA